MAYSKEMRRDILAATEAGAGTRALALRLNVSESWVRRVKQEWREQGKSAPNTTRKRIPKWEAYREQIQEQISQHPDLTLQELKVVLGTELSRSTLCVALKKLKLTLKKSVEGERTRSPRYCATTCGVERSTGRTRSRPSRVHRRNVGQNKHDATAWAVPRGDSPRCQDTARSLENNDVSRRFANHRIDCTAGSRWRNQR